MSGYFSYVHSSLEMGRGGRNLRMSGYLSRVMVPREEAAGGNQRSFPVSASQKKAGLFNPD